MLNAFQKCAHKPIKSITPGIAKKRTRLSIIPETIEKDLPAREPKHEDSFLFDVSITDQFTPDSTQLANMLDHNNTGLINIGEIVYSLLARSADIHT